MKVFNLLLGAYMENEGQDVTPLVKEMMKNELEGAGISVGLFDIATTKDAIGESLKGDKYDVVICKEDVSGELIGGGSISKWRAGNSKLRIILVVDESKKHGKKLRDLWEEKEYYDALYNADMSGENIAVLINQSRTKEAARLYYGIEDNVTVNVQESMEVNATQENEKEFVDIKEVCNGNSDSKPMSDEEFEEAMREIGHLFQEISEVDDGTSKEANSERGSSTSISEENDFLRDIEKITEQEILSKISVENAIDEFERDMEEDKESRANRFMVIPVARKFRTSALPTKGIVMNVMDHNLMMISFDGKPMFIPGEDVSDYRVTVLINKKEKGHVEGGKYSTGLFTIVTYGNCMVDEYTAILEVPDFDLFTIKEQIKGKECNLVLVKHTNNDSEVPA